MDNWIEPFRSELLGGNPIQPETIARVICLIDRSDPRDIDLARTLTHANVDYLRRWQIDQLIEAELSERDAVAASEANREICKRIAEFLPEILRFLRSTSNFSIRYAIDRLVDIAHDFSLEPSDSRRVDKVRNDKLRLLSRAHDAFNQAIDVLAELQREVGEYDGELDTLDWASSEHIISEASR